MVRAIQARWFSSTKDLDANFRKGCFDQMIVFRHCGGELPIKRYLEKIILDDPDLITGAPSKIDYYSMAYGALKVSMTEGGISASIKKRKCPRGCVCETEYSNDIERSRLMYVPKI